MSNDNSISKGHFKESPSTSLIFAGIKSSGPGTFSEGGVDTCTPVLSQFLVGCLQNLTFDDNLCDRHELWPWKLLRGRTHGLR